MKPSVKHRIGLSLASMALFIPFLGSVHLFDWDEINFAECAREMLITGDYSRVQINFQTFWEKPPLFIWMQALSMKLFGVNEFAARFPNALCGIISLNVLYGIGTRIISRQFGLLWAMVYGGTFLCHFYFKSGIIDPWFNLFIFLGVWQAIVHTNQAEGRKGAITATLSGAFIGLAILTKGPVALLIFGLSTGVFYTLSRFRKITRFKYLLLFTLAMLITGFGWFAVEFIRGNGDVIKEFFNYQVRLFQTKDAGHGGFLMYHFVILLLGCFPASFFFISAHKKFNSDTPFQKHTKKWMLVLFWTVLILFTIVKTKIVHYSSLCWFPLTFLAAYTLDKGRRGEWKINKFLKTTMLITLVIIGSLFIALPLVDKWKHVVLQKGLIKDSFAEAMLMANGGWQGWEWLLGLLYLIGMITLLFAVFRFKKNSAQALFIFSALMISAFSMVLVPKVENYSQRAAIDFYESLKGKDVMLETSGFKSYAYLFYSQKDIKMNTPEANAFVKSYVTNNTYDPQFHPSTNYNLYYRYYIIHYKTPYPVYIISKIDAAQNLAKEQPELKEIGRKNGFVFFRKEANKGQTYNASGL